MRIGIISSHPILTIALVERFELQNSVSDASDGFVLYEKGGVILIENTGNIADTYRYLRETFAPEQVFYLSYAFGVNSERYVGDVILPNVFLGVHPDLAHSEIDEGNSNHFFTESYFLKQYDMQRDYDFGEFSLSIGGISVSGSTGLIGDIEFLEKVRIAYEPDALDEQSLDVVHAACEASSDMKTYIIQGLLTGKKNSDGYSAEQVEQKVGENIANVTRYFVESFLAGAEKLEIGIEL